LGVGGLIQAYKTAAQMVLQKTNIIEKSVTYNCTVECTYENLSHVLKYIKLAKGTVQKNEQAETCTIVCRIPVLHVSSFLHDISLNILSIQQHE